MDSLLGFDQMQAKVLQCGCKYSFPESVLYKHPKHSIQFQHLVCLVHDDDDDDMIGKVLKKYIMKDVKIGSISRSID